MNAPTEDISDASTTYDSSSFQSPDDFSMQTSDALSTVTDYYLIKGSGHLSGRKELLKQFGLMLVAVSGAGLYIVPAIDYAHRENASTFWLWNYSISTATAALVILYNSTEVFWEMCAARHIPQELTAYLSDPLTFIQKLTRNTVIIVGSAISAAPLAAVSIVYPIPHMPEAIKWLQAAIVEVDNTVLHLLPFECAFQNRWYRFPSLPFEFLYHTLSNCRLSPSERHAKELTTQKNKLYGELKHYLIEHLNRSKRLLSNYGFQFRGLNYINNAGPEINRLYKESLPPLDLLIKLIGYFQAHSPRTTHSTPSWINRQLRKLSYALGALWVTSSCAGYLIAPVDEMSALTGSETLGIAMSTPSIYFLGVLLTFFGGNALQDTYDYFTSWKEDDIKIPKEFKLYPKTAVLLAIISLYLSLFSYAAAAELIENNFTGPLEFLVPSMLVLAKTGLVFLGVTAILDFFCNILRKCAMYSSNDESALVIKLTAALEQLGNSVSLMKPDLLVESLANLDERRLRSLFNIQQVADKNKLIAVVEKLTHYGDCSDKLTELLGKLTNLAIGDDEGNLQQVTSYSSSSERTRLLSTPAANASWHSNSNNPVVFFSPRHHSASAALSEDVGESAYYSYSVNNASSSSG